MKNISIIVAVDKNNGIGCNNQLLCHLPADMKHFKETTSGHTVIMGRKTWDSLKIQPLPNRKNVVITTQTNFQPENVSVVHSINEAIELCKTDNECFIIGGDSIYKQFIPFSNRIYLTEIHDNFEADTFFPILNQEEWILIEQQDFAPDEKNKYAYSFKTLERKAI
jgi:dihydrofolate reductase